MLAEQFIEGREVNVGLLGNGPAEAFPPVMLSFGDDGPQIYTYEDKTGRSGRTIQPVCPAPIGDELTEQAKQIAVRAFSVAGPVRLRSGRYAHRRRREPLRAGGQ